MGDLGVVPTKKLLINEAIFFRNAAEREALEAPELQLMVIVSSWTETILSVCYAAGSFSNWS